jgi:hypothetical protein
MSDAGADYLPPIITELRGDNSDLLRAFAEAQAAQEAFEESTAAMGATTRSSTRKAGGDVDDFTDLVVRRMRAGEDAVTTLRREMTRLGDDVATLRKRMASEGANQGLYADFKRANDELARMRRLAQQIAPDLIDGGRKGGQGFVSGFMSVFSAIGSAIIPILVGVLVLVSPIIAGLISSAVTVGLGLGFIGAGALIAALLMPKVKYQFGLLGQELKKVITFGVSGAFDDALRTAVIYFQRYATQWKAPLRKIFDDLAPLTKTFAVMLGAGLTNFIDQLSRVVTQISGKGGPLETFMDTIPMVLAAVGEFLIEITKDGPALSRFITDAAQALSSFLVNAGKTIAWLTSAYLWLAKLHDKAVAGGWDTPWHAIVTGAKAVGAFFVWLWGKIVEGAKAAGTWFANIGKSIWAFLTSAGAAVADWFDATIAWFQKLPGRVIGFLASMPGRVQAVVSDLAHKAAYWIGWMVGQWFLFITEAPGKIVSAVAAAWSWIAAKFQEGAAATVDHIKAFPGQVAAFFASLWSSVTAWAARTWTSVTTWFARTKQSMIEHIAAAINAVVSWFRGLPDKAASEGVKFKTRIVKFFSDAKNWLYDAGKNIVKGVVSGITDAWDWAVGKVKSFGHDIVKGFNNAIGAHSPAKEFEKSGNWSALGYVKGWAGSLRKAMRGVAGPALSIAAPPPGGAPRPPGYTPPPSSGGDGAMLHADLYLDGQRFATVTTPAVQRRAVRSGPTGLGFAATGIM